jgi:hypothetical protein
MRMEGMMSEIFIELGLVAMILVPAIATSMQPAKAIRCNAPRVPAKARPAV